MMKTKVLAAYVLTIGPLVLTAAGTVAISRADIGDENLFASEDPSGQLRTFNTHGALDFSNPFFQDLGTNGRRCVTCHQPSAAWTITPGLVQAQFAQTHGSDPLFRPNDGSDCDGVDAVGGSHAAAYSMLLSKAVIRVGMDVPVGAEFQVESVDDPHRCDAPLQRVSMFRRPLPSANLGFLSAVMWDGRESSPTTTILQDLAHQSNDATRGHAQAALDLTPAQQQAIVDFETGLYVAQARDNLAGNLTSDGARGGPVRLSEQPFVLGINDPVGFGPTPAPFDPNVFTLYDAWSALHGDSRDGFNDPRSAVARGQRIFNTRAITIAGVAGLNDETFSTGIHLPDSFTGSCTICHDTPNVGNHSVKAPLNIGLTDESRRTPDMPLYTLMNLATGDTVKTTDPGRAMITGRWRDIGKFKGPVLRALAARAPYFHNGSAATLADVVDFYNARFHMNLTAQEQSDLVAFLRAL
jgi:cytochrome c peroxidase